MSQDVGEGQKANTSLPRSEKLFHTFIRLVHDDGFVTAVLAAASAPRAEAVAVVVA